VTVALAAAVSAVDVAYATSGRTSIRPYARSSVHPESLRVA